MDATEIAVVVEQVLQIVAVVVLAANAVTAVTPSTSDNVVLDRVLAFINVLSLNVGKNKNADAA